MIARDGTPAAKRKVAHALRPRTAASGKISTSSAHVLHGACTHASCCAGARAGLAEGAGGLIRLRHAGALPGEQILRALPVAWAAPTGGLRPGAETAARQEQWL